MSQSLSTVGTRMMSTLLIIRPHWFVFFTIICWKNRCPHIVVDNNPSIHIYFMQYSCKTLTIIILIIFYNLSTTFNPQEFWVRMWHSKGQVSLVIERILESEPILWPGTWELPWCSSFGLTALGKGMLLAMDRFDKEFSLGLFNDG